MTWPVARPGIAPKALARFVSKVNTSGGADACWPWVAARDRVSGYGRFGFGRKVLAAHRVAFTMFVGEIPAGLVVRHRCDVRECVNPAHLELGTPADNAHDAIVRGRQHGATDDAVIAIREARSRGVRLATLAARFGITMASVSRIARGVHRASVR